MQCRTRAIIFVIVLMLVVPAASLRAQDGEVLTNATVVELVQAGVGDRIVIDQINASPSHFDLTTSSILELSKAKVSADVIAAMRASLERFGKPLRHRAAFELPKEFGVYMEGDQGLTAIGSFNLDRYTEKDRHGKVTSHVGIMDPVLSSMPVTTDEEPSFIVFLRNPENAAALRLVKLRYSNDDLPAEIDEDVPTRAGIIEGSSDSRYVRITPAHALETGVYGLLNGESRGLVNALAKADGSADVNALDSDPARTLADLEQSPAQILAAPATMVMDEVRRQIGKKHLKVVKDFGTDGLLFSELGLHDCGLFSLCLTDELNQYAVLVRETDAGTEIHVRALRYHSGLPGARFAQGAVDSTPKVRVTKDEAKMAADLARDVEKEVQKKLKR